MRVTILQENLAKALATVSRAVASRSTLPVLSNVLLATDNGRLRLSATNLEIGINFWAFAKVEEEGAITIPARLLGEFVNALPPERIDLSLDESTQTLNLKCASYQSNIKGISAEEFPIVPTLGDDQGTIQLPPDILRDMISQVVISAATDESRPILTGILAEFRETGLTMAAADGFRLSVKTAPAEYPEATEIIIPARAVTELARLVRETEGPVHMVANPNRKQVIFHMTGADLVSQLIEGKFPDYNQIIPKQHVTRTCMETGSLLKAVRLSDLFARDSAHIVRLTITPPADELAPGQVVLSASSAELGDNVATVDASVEGEPIEIAFNAHFLIEALSVITSPEVALETSSPSSPGVIRPVGDGDFTYVLMPMHLTH